MPELCDHEWRWIDDSFDHEFGVEVIQYWECELCGEKKEPGHADFDEGDFGC